MSSDLAALARRLRQAAANSPKIVLATVFSTEGSAYRRAGAWMVVAEGQQPEGLVSGGCLEADVDRRGRALLRGGGPQLVTYDTGRPDDLVWGLSMGCAGVVEVLIEPLDGNSRTGLSRLLSRAIELSTPAVLVTAIAPGSAPSIIHRILVTETDAIACPRETVREDIVGRARDLLGSRTPAGAEIRMTGDLRVRFDPLLPRIRLVVCGAGEDAKPLARLACDLEWDVLVADHRSSRARPERFPGCRVAVIQDQRDLVAAVGNVHFRTAAVVMTHNFERDVAHASALLPLEIGYLGLLGPRWRGEQVLRAAEALCSPPRRAREIFAPVGLDIASETPREIAVAVVAEISAVFGGARGAHLRDLDRPIHGIRSSPAHAFEAGETGIEREA